jgi:oligopeptide transport system substrate-binding protein
LFPGRVDENLGLLAYHWEQAQDTEKATEFLLRAGDQARLAFAHQEAVDYYERALVFLRAGEDHDRAARTLMKLGLTYHNVYEFKQSRQAFDESFALRKRGALTHQTILTLSPHSLRVPLGDPLTLDPMKSFDHNSSYIISELFSGLVELGAELVLVPDIASHWEVSEDGRRYIFHLRDDVTWSDGIKLTADDFVFACQRTLNPEDPAPYVESKVFYDLKGAKAFLSKTISDPNQLGIKALSEHTLEMELEKPTGNFLYKLSQVESYPIPRHVVEAHGSAWTDINNLVTNGPFKLQSYLPGNSLTLVRNPNYYGDYPGNLQKLELLLRDRTPLESLEMYEKDVLDAIGLHEATYHARKVYIEEYFAQPSPVLWCICFNTFLAPFNNPLVRRAFVMAVDREKLADEILEGAEYPGIGGFILPNMPGHSPGIGLPYDPVVAKELLKQAGYPEGLGFPKLEVHWISEETKIDFLARQWHANLNVTVEVKVKEWKNVVEGYRSGEEKLLFLGINFGPYDVDQCLRNAVHDYLPYWKNDTYDQLMDKTELITDTRERLPLYQQADRILIENAVVMPITYNKEHYLVKPWVKVPARGIWSPLKQYILEPH